MGQEAGTDKDYEHLFFKKNFLAKIYDRDDVGQYKKTFKAVRELKDSKHPLYQDVANGLCELMSTTDASTAQFTEYLNDIHAFCNKTGVIWKRLMILSMCWNSYESISLG